MLDCQRVVRVLPVVINTSLPFVSIQIESELGCRSFHSVPIPIHSTHGKIKKLMMQVLSWHFPITTPMPKNHPFPKTASNASHNKLQIGIAESPGNQRSALTPRQGWKSPSHLGHPNPCSADRRLSRQIASGQTPSTAPSRTGPLCLPPIPKLVSCTCIHL